MKAIQYKKHGNAPEMVELVDLQTGEPEAEGIVVALEAVAINLRDIYEIAGLPGFKNPVPAVPGNKCVGRIIKLGTKVTDLEIGQRVHVSHLPSGTWREQMCVPAKVVYPAMVEADPGELSLVSGGVITAYFSLREFVELKAGDWVIQNSANSNCGRYLVSLAKLWGYRTVNIVRRESVIADLKELGADVVIVDGANLAARVAEATGSEQIRLGIDAVAGEATERIAACVTEGGTVACYGAASQDENCNISVKSLLFRDIRLVGHYIARSRSRCSRQELEAIYTQMGELIVNGTLQTQIAGVYPLSQIRDAISHAMKQGDERRGKVVLVP